MDNSAKGRLHVAHALLAFTICYQPDKRSGEAWVDQVSVANLRQEKVVVETV